MELSKGEKKETSLLILISPLMMVQWGRYKSDHYNFTHTYIFINVSILYSYLVKGNAYAEKIQILETGM